MQVFDASKQKQYPVTNRYVQTILGQPKSVQVYGSQLQPPKQAYSYSDIGKNKWGEGSSPLTPIGHLFAQPWSGQSAFKHSLPSYASCIDMYKYVCRLAPLKTFPQLEACTALYS